MARRLNGEGNIRRRKDGRWQIRIMLGYRDDGKPDFKYFYGRTKREAQEKLDDYRNSLRDGIDPKIAYTFGTWSAVWFDGHKTSIAGSTQESYRYTLRILNDAFAQRRIADVKPHDIEVFLKKLRNEGKADSAIRQCRGMLYQIFNKAEANDLIRKNPVRFAEKMRSSGPKKSKDAFTADEVLMLMEHLPTDKFGQGIRLMLGTGMRTQELLALEPQDISEDGAVIHVRKAVKRVKGTAYVGSPKSFESYRDIPVPPFLREVAKALRDVQTKYVFEMRKKDCPCNPSTFETHYKNALKSVPGVRVLSPHSCRHTYVSQMQALGVDLPTIKSIVGHADLDMTQHYLHVQDNIRQGAVQMFSDAFSPGVHGTENLIKGA